jgi:3-hydroxy-9,10-secoandrosta-1,3,5(10)-triene-9,17-dione monooxygenase
MTDVARPVHGQDSIVDNRAAAMTKDRAAAAHGTHEAVLARVRELIAGICDGAAAAEEARTIPQPTIDALMAAGITRILIPPRFGGYGLGLGTWFEVMREIGKADASHSWIAGLLIHHPHYIGQFAEAAQQAVWVDGPDVAIAASIAPVGRVVRVAGGFRISGRFGFASGINHSTWLIAAAMAEFGAGPEHTWFLIGPRDFKVVDCWFTAAMRATGSNAAMCDDVFVPESHAVRMADLREGTAPGGAVHAHPIFRAPIVTYSALTFVTPMLGAAQGAYELFRDWTRTRRGINGVAIAEITSIQVRLARAAADLDAAELLLRRAVDVAQAPTPPSLALRARSMRDCTRASELCIGAIDEIMAMSGTAGFASSHPIQRAWRDIHFSAMHVTLSPERGFVHFGRTELGLPPAPRQLLF